MLPHAAALLLALSCAAAAAPPKPAIEVEGYVGFAPGQFSYRAYSWAPLRVTVKNTLRPIKGELIVERKQRKGMSRLTRYSRKVDLPKNSRKEFSFTVWLGKGEDQLAVRLRSGGRELVSNFIPLMSALENREMILVLCNTHAPYRMFWQVNPRTREVRNIPERYTIQARPENLPDKWLGFSAVCAIIAERSVFMRLTEAQRDAIKHYVLMGGRLVLSEGGLETGIKEELADDFYPVLTDGNYVETRPAFLRRYGMSPGEDQVLSLLESRLRHGSTVIMEQDGIPLVVRKRSGLGTVTFVAFDLKTPALAGLSGREFFVQEVLGEQCRPVLMNDYAFFSGSEDALPPLGRGPGKNPRQRFETAIREHSMKKIPSVWAIVTLLSVYILAAVPLNYLVFRSIGKLEYAWVALPAISVAFALFGLTAGMQGGARDLVVTGVGVIECAADSPVGVASQVMGVYSPRHGNYELRVPGASALPIHPRSSTGHRGLARKVLELDWTKGTPAARLNVHAHSQRFLETDGVVELGGGIAAELTRNGSAVTGWIRNGTDHDIRDCVIVCMGRAVNLGDLPAGKSAKLDSWEDANANWRAIVKHAWTGPSTPEPEFEAKIADAVTEYLVWQRCRLGPAFLLGHIDGLVQPVAAREVPVATSGLTAVLVRLPLKLAPGSHRLEGYLVSRKLIESNSPRILQGRSLWGRNTYEYGIWRFRLPIEYRHAEPVQVELTHSSTGQRTEKWLGGALSKKGAPFDYLVYRRLFKTMVAKTVPSGGNPRWSVLEEKDRSRWWADTMDTPRLAVVVNVHEDRDNAD